MFPVKLNIPYKILIENYLFLIRIENIPKDLIELQSLLINYHDKLPSQINEYNKFIKNKQNHRAIEYILGEIQYYELRRYCIEELSDKFSLPNIIQSRSHSKEKIGTILGISPVGLDIEDIMFRSNAFEEMLFSPIEFMGIRNYIPIRYQKMKGIESTILWAMKEATFKLQHHKYIGQIKTIQIKFEKGKITAYDQYTEKNFKIMFSIFDNSIIAIASV